MRTTVLAGLLVLLATTLAAWGQEGTGPATAMDAAVAPEDMAPPNKPFPFVPAAIIIAVVAGGAALVMKKKTK